MRTSIIFFINCDLIVKIPGGSTPTTPVITEPVREFIVGLDRLDFAHLHSDLTLKFYCKAQYSQKVF